MRGRTNLLPTVAFCAVILLASARAYHAAPDPHLVARWWPAAALATALLLVTERKLLPLVAATLLGTFVWAGLHAGQGLTFSVLFGLVNVLEAVLVLWWLTRFRDGPPEMRTWSDYRRWLAAITTASALSAALTTALVWSLRGGTPWQTFLWVVITHLGSQTVATPLAMQWPRHRMRVTVAEILGHLTLLVLAMVACLAAGANEPVGYLLLPLLMWAGARFTTLWWNVELVSVTALIAVVTAFGAGPFAAVDAAMTVLEAAASPQAFVAVAGLTTVAFAVAMSHLRESLRRIRENELQLGQLLDSASGTAFIATDPDGAITLFSPGAEQLLGYRAVEVVGRNTPLCFHEPREVRARAIELGIEPSYAVVTAPLVAGMEQDTRDWTYIRKDRSRLTVSLSATAVRDDDGRPVSYLSVVRDVTDRRAAEQALVFALDKEREANNRMQELDRAKSEFVAAVSHELRTPLSSIIGYTELLTEGVSGDLTDAQLELVGRIDRNGERLLHLVEDLLTLARVEEGKFELQLVTTDLCEAVRNAVEEVAATARGRDVALNLALPPAAVCLDGDPEGLRRLVLNLVGNGVKFTRRGGHVDVGLEVNGEVGVLSVRDDGMGIPQNEQSRLFQRFFRSSLATEHAIQGTGLGLNIVRSIAEAHHGQVTFESTPGVGTTFWFTVPLRSPQAQAQLVVRDAQGWASSDAEG